MGLGWLGVAAAAAPYTGLGAESVDPAVVERYAPPPLRADVAARVQLAMDVRAASAGPIDQEGKHLYFTWAITGSNQVWRLDGPNTFPVQLTGGSQTTNVVGLTRDDQWLVISRDAGGTENTGIYLQPVGGGALVTVFADPKVRATVQHLSRDGRSLWYVANDRAADSTSVYRYDLVDHVRELVVGEPGLWNVADERIDAKGRRFLLLTKDTGAMANEVVELDVAKHSFAPVLGQKEQELYRVAYGRPDDRGVEELLVVTNARSDFQRLYTWTKKRGLQPLGPVVDEELVRAELDEPRTHLYLQYVKGGISHPVLLDAATLAPIPLPTFEGALQVSAAPATRDGRLVTMRVTTATAPTRTYALELASGALTAWTVPSSPEVDTGRYAVPRVTTYPARDGTPIPVIERVPAGCEPGAARPAPCPVVIEFHGGPEGQAVPTFSPRDQLYVDAGFVLVQPNVRGSGGFGRAWVEADNGARRKAVLTDIEDAARWAKSRWAVGGQAPKVGVFGGSYGGYATLVAMTLFAGSFDAGVSVVGPANLVTHLTNTAPYRRAVRITEYGDPVADAALLAELSPTSYVDRAKGPLLILQGVDDPRVPVGEALQMHEALVARGVPSTLMLFAGEGHGAARRDGRVAMTGHTLQFFEDHLRSPPPAAP